MGDEGFRALLVVSKLLPDLFGVLWVGPFMPTRKGVLADFGSSLGTINQFERNNDREKRSDKTMKDSSPPNRTGVLALVSPRLRCLTFRGVSSTELSVSSIISSPGSSSRLRIFRGR